MEKPADVQHPIHELLRSRWSPRAFADRPVEPGVLRSLFEAARWAPSSNNEQPWYFIVATRDDREEFDRVLSCLVDGNIAWAKNAPVLMISVAKLKFDNGKPNRLAYHDVGQAAANLTLEATARGLFVHQMGGIHVEKAREVLGIPEGYDPVAGIALGYPGDPEKLSEPYRERELAPRSRKPLASFIFNDRWGHPSSLLQ
ncbi:MAG: nitroreductase family protein [Candidatus Acidiferrales bacterium]